jgi:hypothetical protein
LWAVAERAGNGASEIGEARGVANVSLDVAAFVRARLAEQAQAERNQVGILEAALRHRLALLLNIWGASWGLDEAGRVWRITWGNDFGDPCPVSPEEKQHERNAALYQGSLRFPELKPLVPDRPDDALTCPACKGRGVPPDGQEFQRLIGREPPLCICGGLGWFSADTRIPEAWQA